ncbi:MAG: nucleotide sugar dehydrogenase [Methanoregula sp.]|nr:nucleotide sugar dehydrogenase [Methanoregula sp.]
MTSKKHGEKTVCIIGLGYVGQPLADDFSKHIRTIGYRRNQTKVDELNKTPGNRIEATTDPKKIKEADFVIIAVPTPVTKAKEPDLEPVISASTIVGQNLKKGAIVVLESTVYPGVSEELMAPILEKESGMTCGKDFFVGYSPERINPGDEEHCLKNITKIVAGMDKKTTDDLCELYALVTNVYRAPDIKTAEAAKVIENVQRDLNIALMNELSMIFARLGLDTAEVLKAAGTKWNFHSYKPGMVGGHCIPVDPYYLVKKAKEVGYRAQVILAGRAINDSMPRYVATMAVKGLNKVGKTTRGANVLIMGLTYKEDVPDTRESPAENMVEELKDYDINVYGYDPLLTADEIKQFGAIPLPHLDKKMDAVIIAVAHSSFKEMSLADIRALMNSEPVIIDVRGMVDGHAAEKAGVYYWKL